MSIVLVVAEMEVVCLAISYRNEKPDDMNNRHAAWVLPKIPGLVSLEWARGLHLRRRTSWELAVEIYNTGHSGGILRSSDTRWRGNLRRDESRDSTAESKRHGGYRGV